MRDQPLFYGAGNNICETVLVALNEAFSLPTLVREPDPVPDRFVSGVGDTPLGLSPVWWEE